MMKNKYILFIIVILISSFHFSCSKLLDIPPPDDSVLFSDALKTTEDMQSLLNSCYDVMANTYYGDQQNLSELLSDNLATPYSNDDLNEVYVRQTIFFNTTVGNFYKNPYISVMRANTILENFDRIEDLTAEDKLRFESEARFIRALSHYEVVQLFAQPYGFTTDNSHLGITIRDQLSFDPLPRSTVKEVYDFVINELSYAALNLPESNVINGVPYATSWAAKAMLARVYFQMNDFENASMYAGEVIDQGPFSIDTLNARWSQSISEENIFTIVTEINRNSSLIGNYRSDNNDVPTLRVTNDYFEDLYVSGPTADPSDLRKDWFAIKEAGTANYFYAVSRFDYDYLNIPFLNLTETMLIRAESNAELGTNLAIAIDNINQIKSRAGVSILNENSDASIIINQARLERKKEMIGEGRYAYDLKRRGALGENIIIRGAPWNCPGMILQFPNSEATSNFIMNVTGGCN